MLISEPKVFGTDPILSLLAEIWGHSADTVELRQGIYEIGHFNGLSQRDGYECYPNFELEGDYRGSYGVADNVDQILTKYPELETSDRKFVVTLTQIKKIDEPESGGWRWHKWGTYIGTHDIQCEYLYDEQDIEQVFCFHIYEKLDD